MNASSVSYTVIVNYYRNMKMVLSNKREVQQLSSELSFRAFYQVHLINTYIYICEI